MKVQFESISSASSLNDTFTYKRDSFIAGSTWARSLISGAITTGLASIGVYVSYLASSADLGPQGIHFKLAIGAGMGAMVAYSLRDLFNSICDDVATSMRVSRANSWLNKGTSSTHDLSKHIHMQQTQLRMVRFVESDAGIKVFAIAKNEGIEKPILIETNLLDDEYKATSTYYTHEADIRSALSEACGEHTNEVAAILGITLAHQYEYETSAGTAVLEAATTPLAPDNLASNGKSSTQEKPSVLEPSFEDEGIVLEEAFIASLLTETVSDQHLYIPTRAAKPINPRRIPDFTNTGTAH